MRPIPLMLALALSACSGDRSHAGDTQRSGATKRDESGTDHAPMPFGERPALRANGFVPPSASELDALARELAASLDAGRAALASGAFEPAVAALEQAARLDPTSVETLSLLGTALFELGRFSEAARVRTSALHYAEAHPSLSARAPLLFRLGNAVEFDTQLPGHRDWASEIYQRSLELAPNPEVEAALVRLTQGAEVVGHVQCGWAPHGAPPDLAQLCPAYLRAREGGANLECAWQQGAEDALTIGEGPERRQVTVFSVLEGERELLVAAAIIPGQSAGQWFSAPLGWLDHPKATYADENLVSLELRAEDLAAGGLPEVVIEWEIDGRAIELEARTEHRWRTRDYAVLNVAGHGPRWFLGLRTRSSHARGPITSEAAVALEFNTKTGELEVVRTDHEPSARLGKFALGTYPLLCPYEIGAS